MGGIAKSAGGFLGLSSGPQAPGGTFTQTSDLTDRNYLDRMGQGLLTSAAKSGDVNSAIQDAQTQGLSEGISPESIAGLQNQLATGATTGSQYATQQVQNNPMLSGLFGSGGQLNQAESKLTDLNNQGFELKPEDMTLYGQTSGNIARMFGAQGNQASQDLANRGLASAPSGAAGAMFSGLNGNQNEMLAQAQQQIMQQRFQNTQNQIQQQQNFVSSLGQQGANDINQQYGRQLQGDQNQTQKQQAGVSAQSGQNNYGMQAADFNVSNTPQNAFDMAQGGVNAAMGAGGKNAGQSMFAGKTPAAVA